MVVVEVAHRQGGISAVVAVIHTKIKDQIDTVTVEKDRHSTFSKSHLLPVKTIEGRREADQGARSIGDSSVDHSRKLHHTGFHSVITAAIPMAATVTVN